MYKLKKQNNGGSAPQQQSGRTQNNNRQRNQRSRQNGAVQTSGKGSNVMVQAQGVSNKVISRSRPLKMAMEQRVKLSKEGNAFLKCAFAPPDFANTNVAGVPDDFMGKSLIKKHRYVAPFALNAANTDYYFILAPIPGIAYAWTSVTAANPLTIGTVFQGVPYSDSSFLFASGGVGISTNSILEKFRYVSNHIEFIPTTNAMQWTGNIECFKTPLTFFVRPGGVVAGDTYTIGGLRAVNATNPECYVGPFNLGLYSGCYSAACEFEFQTIPAGIPALCPLNVLGGSGDWGQFNCGPTMPFTAMDNQFESLIIKVSGMGTNTLNTFILKTWACVEYQAGTGSILYEYQSISPCDKFALDIYRRVINELPVGVSFVDNDSFWTRVLSIIRRLAGLGSYIPGPVGLISSGVGAVASGIESLSM